MIDRHCLLPFLLATSALAPLACATAAHAQTGGQHNFDIAGQPLAEALRLYMRQSGVQISWSGMDLTRRQAPAVKGRMSSATALSRVLEGSGLLYRFTAPTSVVLEPVPPSAENTVQLGTLRVEGVSAAGIGPTGDATNGKGDPAGATYRSAQSKAYRDREDIQRLRGTSPGDFLSGITGVINGENRNSGAIDVNIRGMQGMDRVPVVIDGSLQQSTVYRGYSGVSGRTYLDPDLIGSVTVEKGPSAAADGVGATGGVVRVNTLGASDLIADGGHFGIQARAGMTGNNSNPPEVGALGTGNGTADRLDRPGLIDLNGWNASVAVAAKLGPIDLVGAFARRKIGNYFGGEHGIVPVGGTGINGITLNRYNHGEEVLSTSQDNTSYLVRAVIHPDPDMAIDLSYIRYESDFGEMMPSQIIRFGGAMQAPLSRTEVDTVTGRFRWNPGQSKVIDLKLDAWATSNFTNIVTLYRYQWGTGPVINQDAAYMSQSNRWGINLSNGSKFDTPLGALALDYGVSYNHERLKPPSQWADYEANSGYSSFLEPRNGKRREYSAFIAGELKPEPWLTVTGSLRYTDTKSQDFNSVAMFLPDLAPEDSYNRESSHAFAPTVSVLVEPVSGIQFYGRYAEATRAPSLFETTTGFSFYPDPRTSVRPERARNVEVGLNVNQASVFAVDDLLQGKASFFHNDIRDYLTRIPGEDGFPTDVANIERAQFQGFELSGHYDMGAIYADVGGTLYTYRRFCANAGGCAEGNTTNSYIPAHIPPKFSASATLGARLFDERLDIGARYTHMSSRDVNFTTFQSTMTVIEWDAYDLFDLYGRFQINDRLQFDLAIDNLTDRYYTDALSLGLMPSPGRTVRLGVSGAIGGPKKPASATARERAIAAALGEGAPRGEFSGNWGGPYLGVLAGHGWIGSKGATTAGDGSANAIAATESARNKASGAQVGAFGGMNWQFGNLVAGLESDIAFSKTHADQVAESTQSVDLGYYPASSRLQASLRYDFQWLATARARLGYASGNMLFYGTGGLAFLRESQRRTQYRDTAGPDNLSPDNLYGNFTEPTFTETTARTRKGWTVGSGVEVALGKRWALKAEYLYSRFGKQDFRFKEARAGIGNTYSASPAELRFDDAGNIIINPETGDFWFYDLAPGDNETVNGRRARNSADMHSLRIGISFRF